MWLVTGGLCAALVGCGGGSEQALTQLISAVPETVAGAFERFENDFAVNGTVTSTPLVCAGTEDPETAFTQLNISGKWGTLAGLDGSSSLPDATRGGGLWTVHDNILYFAAKWIQTAWHQTDGFALVSQATLPRTERVFASADLSLDAGNNGAFAGVALIAGEGDYREIAYRRTGETVALKRVAPCEETTLVADVRGWNNLRIEYVPGTAWRYVLNGQVVHEEPLAGPLAKANAGLSADPHVGLYFAGLGSGGYSAGRVKNLHFQGMR